MQAKLKVKEKKRLIQFRGSKSFSHISKKKKKVHSLTSAELNQFLCVSVEALTPSGRCSVVRAFA